MTDKKIEEYLAAAVEKNTPDILDALMADLDRAEEPIKAPAEDPDKVWTEVRAAASEEKPAKASGAGWRRSLMSLAAVFVLLVGGFGIYGNIGKTFAVVGLDVNPSVELSISRNEKVKAATAINSEGEDILAGMNLEGTDVNTACNAIVGAMLTKGYLTTATNSVLVSVRSDDAERGKEIEKKIAEDLNSYLGSSDISPSVMGQYVEDDDELEAFAEANGISEGKAWLIRNLLASGSTSMTEESLLKLSTQELILLGQEKNVGSDNYGSADTSKYISRDKAIDAALKSAGITKAKATGIRTEFDADDGKIVYEVEFVSGGIEYDYDIDAVTGKVVKAENEKADADDTDDDDDDRYDDDDDRHDRDDDDDDDDDWYDRDDDDDDD